MQFRTMRATDLAQNNASIVWTSGRMYLALNARKLRISRKGCDLIDRRAHDTAQLAAVRAHAERNFDVLRLAEDLRSAER